MFDETEAILAEPFDSEEMPTFNQSNLCVDIIERILEDKRFKPLPELTLDIDNGITPDISVYPRDKAKPNYKRDVIRYPEMPVLAIEIASPTQNLQTLFEKAEMLINNGVQVVWTIEPFTNSIVVTNKHGIKRFQNQAVESEGIKVDFRKIFGDS